MQEVTTEMAMAMIPYHYLRALEIEGRHPQDAGCWLVTKNRLELGEGVASLRHSLGVHHFPRRGALPFHSSSAPRRFVAKLLLPPHPIV